MNRLKYICVECDYQMTIIETKKDMLKNKKYDTVCPKCHKEMTQTVYTDSDRRASEITDLLFERES